MYYVVVGELLDYLFDLCVLGSCWELLDITALLEQEAQAFPSANHVYVTNKMLFNYNTFR